MPTFSPLGGWSGGGLTLRLLASLSIASCTDQLSERTCRIDAESWAAIADDTEVVRGDAQHSASTLPRFCRRSAAGDKWWEVCDDGESSSTFLLAAHTHAFDLLPVRRERQGAQPLYPQLMEAETLARCPSAWVHHVYAAEVVHGVPRYRNVPSELLRAETYPVAPSSGKHKSLFTKDSAKPNVQLVALEDLGVIFYWLRLHETADANDKPYDLPPPSYKLSVTAYDAMIASATSRTRRAAADLPGRPADQPWGARLLDGVREHYIAPSAAPHAGSGLPAELQAALDKHAKVTSRQQVRRACCLRQLVVGVC